MKLINGFKDFEKLIINNDLITTEIWKVNYYLKYNQVFDEMLKYLYHLSIDDLLKLINNTL